MIDYVGKTVLHGTFGKGEVKEIVGDKVILNFNGVEKKFPFPNVFESLAKFDDADIQDKVMILIKEMKQKKVEENAALSREREEQKKQIQQSQKEKLNERVTPRKETLIKGETFRTHSDVLNECFGFRYKSYQQAFKVVDDKFAVWFPNIARNIQGKYVPTEKSNGWINVLSENETVITETNKDKTKNTERERKFYLDRFVFAKFDEDYRFIGVYGPEKSDEIREKGYRYSLIGTRVNLRTMEIS